MMNKSFKLNVLSGNVLKIIALISMVIDHVGYLLFPEVEVLRIIGRISFPIFAFMIAEGCYYTKNKWRYFINVFSLALLCQIVYFFFSGEKVLFSLICFSVSIPLIYLLEYLKRVVFEEKENVSKKIFICLAFILAVIGVYLLDSILIIEFGFWGCILPVFASLFRFKDQSVPASLKKFDNMYVHLFLFSIGVFLLSINAQVSKYFALLSLPFLFLYSGKRGKYNIKYFFYLFYPLHFLVIQAIYMIWFN